MRFGVLGPVEAYTPDGAIDLGQPRNRVVLAYLLLHRNWSVTTDRLARALWDDAEPATARSQIQVSVSRLRRVLRQHDFSQVIVTRPGGYQVVVGDDEVDSDIFRREMATARAEIEHGRPEDAVCRLRRALALWRGDALTDVAAPFARPVRRQLQEERVAALELLAEVEVTLGRLDTVIAELIPLVADNPCRERLVCQLMLAQYRAGQRADALETARWTRATLVERYGLDPGRRLVELEYAILTADPGLDGSVGDKRVGNLDSLMRP